MSKTHLVVPDQHAHWQHNNDRADWLSNLIIDIRPDVVINIGDSADMPSLSGYDKGKRAFQGRTYRADINAHLDFQDRVWAPVRRRKQKLPERWFFIGNHEQRIEKALDLSPELQGAIGMDDLNLKEWYNNIIPYEGGTPGKAEIDGVWYAHYFSSGVMGRAIGGEHPATSLLSKRFSSSTCGHLHLADWSIRTSNDRKIMGMFCGVFQDYRAEWAGDANDMWWSGVVVKRNVENGQYDPEFISIESLRKEYGQR
jgi:hypothetical protein